MLRIFKLHSLTKPTADKLIPGDMEEPLDAVHGISMTAETEELTHYRTCCGGVMLSCS